MSYMTIHIPDELESRIVAVAERTGRSTDNLILEAISDMADFEEIRLDFADQAETRMDKIASTGETIVWSDMREYLENRAAGKSS